MTMLRIKPAKFWKRQWVTDLFYPAHRQAKLSTYVAKLATTDELIDFVAIARRWTQPVRVLTAPRAAWVGGPSLTA